MMSGEAGSDVLKAGALGTLGATALGVAMMAPALGIYANLGLISSGAGNVAPAVFLVALLCTVPTAVSYALLSREIPSAGSAYTWLSESTNPFFGVWMGLLLVSTYFIAVILQPILFGLFFNELLTAFSPFQIGYGTWMIGVLLSTALVALLAYPGIEISAKGSTVITVLGMVVVLALACTILMLGSREGRIQFQPFNPAASLHGSQGFFRGLIFGLLCFVGFSVITTAAEETRSPRSIIPRVVVTACVLLGIFWAFVAWGFSLALPAEAWGEYVVRGVNPVAVVAREYWGSVGSFVVVLTALVAVLGVYLAALVGYARVVYAMGRDGTLPGWFGRLHPKFQVPWNAQHLVLIVAVAVAVIWGRWLGLYLSYEWWGSSLVFFAMVTNIFVNIGCTVFFYRFRQNQFNWLKHGFVPSIGIVTSFIPLYYSFGPDLWNAGWKMGQSVILFSVALVVFSALYTVVLSFYKPEVLRRASERVEG